MRRFGPFKLFSMSASMVKGTQPKDSRKRQAGDNRPVSRGNYHPNPQERNSDQLSSRLEDSVSTMRTGDQSDDLSFLSYDLNRSSQQIKTSKAGFSFSEVLTTVFPNQSTFQDDTCSMHSFQKVSCKQQTAYLDVSTWRSESSPSNTCDVAIVPQTEWDLLFEMALKAASWRMAPTDLEF